MIRSQSDYFINKINMLNKNLTLHVLIFALVGVLATTTAVSATDYYVDFENGDDSHDGRAPDNPWKRAPGDPNAAGTAASVDLQGGDVIHFKGGVIYSGTFLITEGGTDGNPISYSGSSWGEKPAIIDGTRAIYGTTEKCTETGSCPAFTSPGNIYKFTPSTPIRLDRNAPVFVNGRRYWMSRSVTQKDMFWFDDLTTYHTANSSVNANELKATSLSVSAQFWPQKEQGWGDTLLRVWVKPNLLQTTSIKSLDRDKKTVFFTNDYTGKIYTGRKSFFAFFNRPFDINEPGEFAVDFDESTDRDVVYFLAYEKDFQPNNHIAISLEASTFTISGADNLTIDGFWIRRFYGAKRNNGSGFIIVSRGKDSPANLQISNNKISEMKTSGRYSSIDVGSADNVRIFANYFTDNQKSRAITIRRSKNVTFSGNYINKIGGTGILVMESENVSVRRNVLEKMHGIHANGMAVYLNNKRILVEGNNITDSSIAFAYHGPKKKEQQAGHDLDLLVINNVFLGMTASWSAKTNGVAFAYNHINNVKQKSNGFFFKNNSDSIFMTSNIIDGVTIKKIRDNWVIKKNLYTNLAWTQSAKYGWSLEEGSIIARGSNFDTGLSGIPAYKEFVGSGLKEIEAYLDATFPELDAASYPRVAGPSPEIYQLKADYQAMYSERYSDK